MAKLLGIQYYELKLGVNPDDFERFARVEWLQVPWARTRFVKCDRGDRLGQYAVIWEFESVEERDRWFPAPGSGGYSPGAKNWFEEHAQFLYNFQSYATELGSSDYVEIVSK